ncbi:MAG: twitching motility protein PilT [Chloroflexota bacterium]|nr:putative toxin-antitoxin system toxin component, PIN family [Chloroflexota bacterium]GIK58744.1 MAG: twitching motility protein PilT [Chloroflexota bacterium]
MRVVLDTNQLVAALLRPPELATFVMAWEAARFTVVASPALVDEYLHVLAYPEVAALIYPELRRAFTSHLLDDIELIEPPEVPRLCRDPDDDKVIAVAIFGLADYILTVDKDLMAPEVNDLLAEMGISIISSAELLQILDSRSDV